MTGTPTARAAALATFDDVWATLMARLDGIDDVEAHATPVAGMWGVLAEPDLPDGIGRVAGAGEREVDPAPVTTIAWRLWHIAVDCLDSYAVRRFGTAGAGMAEPATWPLAVTEMRTALDGAWRNWRDALDATDAAGWDAPIGDAFGPFGASPLDDLVAHALREVTHHAAEVALLRDLHRWGV